ncbi:hypothetical protein [Streptomyces olivaceus]|uniref:hypothetical protein n=1 Tax=Streptomyces olivaceus TaxID=47716 RepID=UPI001CCC5A31|nr:hypothetical protein [Streptomyces olivaceus]MBZ6231680.1 hypothetical protein [Streptomyces olivaceus]
MTPSLRLARALRAAALLLVAVSVYAATHQPWLALPGLYTAGVLAWCAAREQTEHRRRTVRARRAEWLARPCTGPVARPEPCCAFWRNSGGAVHGPDCARPAAARVPLYEDCCERWWTSLGAQHDAACRRRAGTAGRDRARPAPQ